MKLENEFYLADENKRPSKLRRGIVEYGKDENATKKAETNIVMENMLKENSH